MKLDRLDAQIVAKNGECLDKEKTEIEQIATLDLTGDDWEMQLWETEDERCFLRIIRRTGEEQLSDLYAEISKSLTAAVINKSISDEKMMELLIIEYYNALDNSLYN
jgi:hypothetical protein